jgi:hypothetical protein
MQDAWIEQLLLSVLLLEGGKHQRTDAMRVQID